MTVAEHPTATRTPVVVQAPDRRSLHALLLGLSGRIPDESLAEMRTSLADGEEDHLAYLLAGALAADTLSLTADEAALTRAALAANHMDSARLDHIPHVDRPPSPYRFEDGLETRASDDPALDLAVVRAAEQVGGLLGIWRVFRRSGPEPAVRVYLAEAEPMADAAELVAEMQYALAEGGSGTPRVEVFNEGAVLAPYHDAALAAGVLVWPAAGTSLRLARTFDGADRDQGPFFRPDHPRLDPPVGERVLAYLRSGEVVFDVPGAMDDLLDADRPAAVPVGFRSDGHWIWPDAVAYYLKRHRLAPEPELVAHILDATEPPRALSRLARQQAVTTLFAPSEVEPVWQAG
jgi:hypothetical protein